MNWLDVVVVAIVVGVASLEAARGFGQTLLDALLLYGALCLASFGAPLLAASLHLAGADPSANRAAAYALLLVGGGMVACLLSRLLHQQTQIDAGMCNRLFGMIAGVAVGMIAAHSFVRVVAMGFAGGSGEMLVANSFLGHEMLSFSTYHSLITSLTGEAPMHQSLPG